jgi:two-component system LytT family response regulator
MITALLIDDDSNLRNGMKGMLDRYAPDIHILGEADSVTTGVEAIETYRPDVIILDIQLGDGTGFDILEQLSLKNISLASHVVFITAHEQYAVKSFQVQCP